ncbi:MAG: hypothetical protein V1689_02855 [Pseudomonadota bacterium]
MALSLEAAALAASRESVFRISLIRASPSSLAAEASLPSGACSSQP